MAVHIVAVQKKVECWMLMMTGDAVVHRTSSATEYGHMQKIRVPTTTNNRSTELNKGLIMIEELGGGV